MICADINHGSKDTSAVSRWLLWSADGLGSDGQAFKLAQLIESNFSRHKEIQLKTYRALTMQNSVCNWICFCHPA